MDTIPLNTDYLKFQASNKKFEELSHFKEITSNNKTNTEEIAKAARGFESMFISLMLKEMKNAMLENESNEDEFAFGADTLLEYTDLMLADQLSQTQTGIGIAKMIYKHLTGGDELQPLKIIQPKQKDRAISNNTTKKSKINYPEQQKNESQTNINTRETGNNFIERVNQRLNPYSEYIDNLSQQFNIPSKLIKSIITVESAGINDAVSTAGAKGLMQLMDGTANDMGINDSFNPFENIFAGTKYISKMLELFDGDLTLALAAYNAGPGNVLKYGTIPPFKETQNYVRKVLKYLDYFD